MFYFYNYGKKCIRILEDLYLGLEYGLCPRDPRQRSCCVIDRNRLWTEIAINFSIRKVQKFIKEIYKAYLTNLPGRTRWRASRAAARGANLLGALRCHWSNRKYDTSKFRFQHAKYFLGKLSAIWVRALKMFASPDLGRKRLKNICFNSFCSLFYDRSIASSKASSPQGAI
jgi:hypothetical protein